MTFKIIENPEFTIDVEVPNPGAEGSQQLKTTFRAMAEDEVELFDLTTRDGMKDALRNWIVAFHDIENAEGKVSERIEPADAAFELILSQPNARIALNNAYHFALVGHKGPRRGN